jgi:hypothetical protein
MAALRFALLRMGWSAQIISMLDYTVAPTAAAGWLSPTAQLARL